EQGRAVSTARTDENGHAKTSWMPRKLTGASARDGLPDSIFCRRWIVLIFSVSKRLQSSTVKRRKTYQPHEDFLQGIFLAGVFGMQIGSETSTSPTLLGRLQRDAADQEAWRQFVRRYGPRIYHWCRRWDLQEADAQDVTQNVLLKLVAKLRAFRYDPARSFR